MIPVYWNFSVFFQRVCSQHKAGRGVDVHKENTKAEHSLCLPVGYGSALLTRLENVQEPAQGIRYQRKKNMKV